MLEPITLTNVNKKFFATLADEGDGTIQTEISRESYFRALIGEPVDWESEILMFDEDYNEWASCMAVGMLPAF